MASSSNYILYVADHRVVPDCITTSNGELLLLDNNIGNDKALVRSNREQRGEYTEHDIGLIKNTRRLV